MSDQYRDSSNLDARSALHTRFSTNPYDFHRWLFNHLAVPPSARLLELGCGAGTLWLKNLDRLPTTWNVILTDASLGMVHHTASQLSGRNKSFGFAIVDAQLIPFPRDPFDAVIANSMLYHVANRPRALAEIARVLKPTGALFAATHGTAHLHEIKARAERAHLTRADEAAVGDVPEFSLENGGEQLADWFDAIELQRYADALVVTETEPLVAAVLSGEEAHATLAGQDRNAAARTTADLRSIVSQQISDHGAVHVTKETGLFIARGPRAADPPTNMTTPSA